MRHFRRLCLASALMLVVVAVAAHAHENKDDKKGHHQAEATGDSAVDAFFDVSSGTTSRKSGIDAFEEAVDFRGRAQRLDHLVDFPAPVFRLVGPYEYVVELDGKEVARLPGFDIKIGTA